MPPQITDDDMSGVDEVVTTTTTTTKVLEDDSDAKEELKVQSENEAEGDEDEEEDVYVVEKILEHMFDAETGELKFRIQWEGYENEEDQTWEGEDNLETAGEILAAYYKKLGGKEAVMASYEGKKKKNAKKRGRAASSGTPQGSKDAKRGRKNGTHPADTTPPAGVRAKEFKPPSGSWENEVTAIDACEDNGEVVVFLSWKGGHKTKHQLSVVYNRCPQKMLKFYEKHLVFKQVDPKDPDDS